MIARAHRLLASRTFNEKLDRVLFVGGALALALSIVLTTASFLAA